jgi:hypothetical protein
MVDESPWFIWKLVIKEASVLISAVLVLSVLLLQSARAVRALFALGPTRATQAVCASWIQQRGPALVVFVAITAIAWATYLSFRGRPVLPVGTIFGFGVSAGLSLIISFRRSLWKRSSRKKGNELTAYS